MIVHFKKLKMHSEKVIQEIKTKKFFNTLEKSFINDKGLFKRSVSVLNLKKAWHQLKNNSKKLTIRLENNYIDNINEFWFENTSQTLINGTFKYPTAKKINISKHNTETKLLNIADSRIKIIEKALLNPLEIIFEGAYIWSIISEAEFNNAKINLSEIEFKKEYKIILNEKSKKFEYKKKQHIAKKVFKNSSFGFRKKKSAHQALYHIKNTWGTNTRYFLDYDIKKAFENINKNRLKNAFNRYVKDLRVWEEIEKMLNAGYINDDMLQLCNIGVVLNSNLSPLLYNLYMHDLDQLVENLNKKNNKKNIFYKNKDYGDLEAKKNYNKLLNKYSLQILKTYRGLGSQEKFISEKKKDFFNHHEKYSKIKNINLTDRRIQYARYADNIIIGITGPRKFAMYVRKEIDTFIKSDLHLKINKNEIIHRDQNPITFLGHNVQFINFHGKIRTKKKQLEAIFRYKNKTIQNLKSKENRIVKFKTDKFKNEMLKHANIMLNELNLTSTTNSEKLNLLVSLSTYKSFGNMLAKNLNLNNFKELVQIFSLLNYKQKLANPTLNKLSNTVNENLLNEQGIAMVNINSEISNLKHFNNYKIEKIDSMLQEIQNAAESKTKELSNNTILKFMENKSRYVREKHIKRQIKIKNEKSNISGINHFTKPGLQNQCTRIVSIKANITLLRNKLRLAGFMHPIKNQASSCQKLIFSTESEIINYYNCLMLGILNWFSGADNFSRVKGILESILRRSCLLTLKRKFKLKNISEAKSIYTMDLTIINKTELSIKLISRKEINKTLNIFNIKMDPFTNNMEQQLNWELILNNINFLK
jgi:Type II intron maturase/Reverse transcriptase (RNA-dependent DNA polymerase)